MFTLIPDTNSAEPLYQQLYRCIKNEIICGNIRSGERLPSKRALAQHLRISVVTVESAYAQLVAEGYATARRGSGYYAESFTDEPPQTLPEPAAEELPVTEFDFRTNRVDTADFPFSTWAKLSREVLCEQSSELLNACHPQGTAELRTEIAAYLRDFRGLSADPSQIVVGAGSEYLLGLIIQLLGRDNAYGVENPGYTKIYSIFSTHAFRVFPVPMDECGANADAISGFGINVLHVTPSHHFPLGIVMPVGRRQQLLRWAYAAEDRYIIEDDCDSEFRHSGRPIQTMYSMDKRGRVIYINTFTKSLAPSMRISYMVLPEPLCARFSSKLGFYSCTVPVFEQLTLAKFMHNGHFDRHISRMRRIYRRRRDILLQKIADSRLADIVEVSGCDAGMHLLLTVNNGMDQSRLLSCAAKEGARVYALSGYYSFPVSDMPKNTVVAGFAGLDEQQLSSAVQALERAWAPK